MVFVRLNDRVMMCIWECRVKDYEKFDRAWLAKHRNELRAIPGVNDTAIPCLPAVMVTWNDATRFCEALTQEEIRNRVISPSHRYRLPTDLEWSHAIGLNVNQEMAAGRSPKDRHLKVANVYSWGGGPQWPPPVGAGNYPGNVSYDRFEGLAPAGMFAPNALGIFDLGGNVWEWCEDDFDGTGKERVVRGNSWNWQSHQYYIMEDVFNASYRHRYQPLKTYDDVGFRCVIELQE
jgi:formylglycine-generating enzyme required for sulfatase activity